jgi:hypothetical protein
MNFSFANLGFWRLAVLSFAFELAHALLQNHWPGIQGSRIGPRPAAARYFMGAEAIALIVALSAAIGMIGRMLRLSVRPTGQMTAVALTAIALLGMFVYVWQR